MSLCQMWLHRFVWCLVLAWPRYKYNAGHTPPDLGVLSAKSEGAKFRQGRLSVWWTRSVRGSRSPIFDSVSLQAVKTSVMPINRSSSGPIVNVCLWCDSWVKIRLNSQVSVLSSALNTLPLHLLITSIWNQDVCFGLLSKYWNRTIFLSIDQRFCAQVKSYLLFIISSSLTKGGLTLGNRAVHKHSCPLNFGTDGSGVLEQRFQPWFLQTINTFSHLLLGDLMHISAK